jgi:outer membrane protein assembly factor BamB
MKQTTLLFVSLLLLTACKNSSGNGGNSIGDWTIFRGNPSLSGYTDCPLPDHPLLLWSFKSDSYTKSSPIVYHGVAYWSSRRGHVFGVDIEGKQVFDYTMETAVDATPMIHDSTLYIGRMDGNLSAISLITQELLWNFETWGQISASPNIINLNGKEAIVVGSYDNYLYCMDSESGKEINRFESGYYLNGAVALNGQYVVYGGCDGWIRVVDCIAGVQTDSLDVVTYIPASPAISNHFGYIADHSGNVYEIKLDDGRIASHKKIIESQDDNRTFVSVPAVSDKMIYIVSDDRHLYAIHRKDGAIAWKYLLKGDTGESSPVICKDKILVCTKSGIVSIHNAKTGNLLWEYDTGEQIYASPAVINGYFYILTFKGTLFCFR